MALKLPKFDRVMHIVQENLTASIPFHMYWQKICEKIEDAFNQLETVVLDIQAAQAAADAAQASANAAQTSANNAQTAANNANASVALVGSGVSGVSIVATDAGADVTINISAHTRLYGNGSSVSVNAGSITGLSYSTGYYIYYDQASMAGGAVTYQATTNEATAAQTGARHLVGEILTPALAAPDTNGNYVRPAGVSGL